MTKQTLFCNRFVWILLGLLGLISSCQEQSDPCSDHDPFCRRRAKAVLEVKPSTIYVGQQIKLNAADSIFDDIEWFQNGANLNECKHKIGCVLTMNTSGIYEFTIKATVNQTAKISQAVTLGNAGNPESTDKDSVTVEVKGLESNNGVTSCTTGATAYGGIIIQEDGNDCVIMETGDRGKCRSSDGYANCKTWSQASTLCDGGTTPGTSFYLPSRAELGWVYSQRGSGSPESSNGFCVATVSPCIAAIRLWSREIYNSFNHYSLRSDTGAEGVSIDDANLSVRCVKRLPIAR